jgi:hypothetical protein
MRAPTTSRSKARASSPVRALNWSTSAFTCASRAESPASERGKTSLNNFCMSTASSASAAGRGIDSATSGFCARAEGVAAPVRGGAAPRRVCATPPCASAASVSASVEA